jgi:Ca-activated chloride channel family protein
VAAGLVVSVIAIAAFGGRSQDPTRFSSRVDVVNVTATVTDGESRFVSGLGRTDFAIFEDGGRRDVEFFADESAPVSLGILLDASGSMTGRRLDLARQSVARLVAHDLDSASEWLLARFGYSLVILQDWTSDRAAVVQPLRETRATGDTALYDAIALAVPLVNEGRLQKKALLVVSDGGESKSLLSLDEVLKAIGQNDVRVFAIGVDATPGSRGERVNMDALRRVADDTGGNAHVVKNDADVVAATARIADELRHEYLLGYTTHAMGDRRRHAVRVEVLRRGMKVRARRGFVAD